MDVVERISLKFEPLLAGLKHEEGQGATEYAMIIGFLVVTLAVSLGLLGGAIGAFLGRVATAVNDLT